MANSNFTSLADAYPVLSQISLLAHLGKNYVSCPAADLIELGELLSVIENLAISLESRCEGEQ